MIKDDEKKLYDFQHIIFVDKRPIKVITKNISVPLNRTNFIKIPKGLTYEEYMEKNEYFANKMTLKADCSDRKEDK